MDAQFRKRVSKLFHAAVELPADERSDFLREASQNDPHIIAEVEELLRHDHDAAAILDLRLSQTPGIGFDASLRMPEHVGPYRTVRELGRGGMSVVYLAERDDLDSLVALKVLATGPLSPFGAERFFAEERVLARLQHPSIARILDAGILPGEAPYFVMEYVNGTPVTDHVEERNPSLRSLLRLFLRICEAVSHAHRQAVIHRDLKPSNILVTAEGQVKLLDFGIAKRLDEDVLAVAPTIRMLTPAYAAPEQIRGEPVGVQADVYSLGVVLYEMLTGKLPVDPAGKSAAEFERMFAHLPNPPSRCLRVTIPSRRDRADVDSLCLRALSPHVTERYPSVETLARDVERFLADRPLEARKPVWRYRAGKFARRNRRPLTASAGVLALLIGVTLYYSMNLANARDSAIAEAERVQRIQHFMLGLFEHDDAGVGPSDTLRLVTVLDHGVQEAHLLEDEPDIQAELFHTLGGIYLQRGDLDRADSLLGASVRLRRSRQTVDAPALARSLIGQGRLRVEQARLEDADALIEEGIELTTAHLPSGHPDVAEAMIALGTVHQARGDYDRAIEAFEEAVRMLKRQRNTGIALTGALGQLASSHFYAGRHTTSDSLNRIVLAMEERAYGRRHPSVAGTLVNLGATRFQLGYYQDAEQLYRRALEIYLGYHGRDHHLTASNMSMLAQTLVVQNRLDEAMDLLRPALEVRERVLGPMHPRVASTLNELGTIALEREDLDEAESYFRRMLDIYLHTYDGDHYLIGIAHSNLATVHHARRDFDRAEEAMHETIRVMTSALSAEHMQTAIALVKMGRVLMASGRLDDAEVHVRRGLAILETQMSAENGWAEYAANTLSTILERRGESDGVLAEN